MAQPFAPSTHYPSSKPAVPDCGQGALQDPAGLGKAVNASRGGGCSSRTGRPPKTILRLRLGQQGGGGRSLTDCVRAAEEDKRPCGEGRNRTENSEATAAWSPRPATSSSPAERRGQGPRRGQAHGLRGGSCGIWDTRVRSRAHRTCVRGAGRAACPTPPPLCPAHPRGPSPSLTEMVGFFCRSPSKMKKRTRGMNISKAKTHWKDRQSEATYPAGQDTPEPPLPARQTPTPEGQPGPAQPGLRMLPRGPQKVSPSSEGPFKGQKCGSCPAQVRNGSPAPQPGALATLRASGGQSASRGPL